MPDRPVGGQELDELRDSIEAALEYFASSLSIPEEGPKVVESPLRPSEGETMETGSTLERRRRARRVSVGVGVR